MITVLLEKTDKEGIILLKEEFGDDLHVDNIKAFDGLSEMVQAIVPLSGIAATLIYKIVKERLRAKRFIGIKYKGMEVSGVDEKYLLQIMEKIVDETKKDN